MENNLVKLNIETLKPYLQRCYSPYSHFNVACMLVIDNKKYDGVNVENCSYSLTSCSEKNCINSAITDNADLKNANYILIITNSANSITPCGSCRQILAEFFNKDFIIYTSGGTYDTLKKYTLEKLLPDCFIK